MRRILGRVTITAALASTMVAAHALGLGEIDVDSHLNQRFSASVPLTEISAEDLETVTVTIAPNESFERAGIERGDYLSSLAFTIKSDRGSPRVVINSSQIAREPVVNLLIQARWKGGKIQREYTVLLDPPELVAATRAAPVKPVAAAAPVTAATAPVAVVSAPAPVAKPAPKPVAPPPAPIIAAPTPAPTSAHAAPPTSEFYQTANESPTPTRAIAKPKPAAAGGYEVTASSPASTPVSGGEFYGPVLAKETLWSIATKLRPDPRVTMEQMQLALALANPKTILRGTTVSKGSKLAVPTPETIRAVSPTVAKARLATLRSGGSGVVAKPTAPVPPAKAVEKAVEKAEPKSIGKAFPSVAPAASKPVAKAVEPLAAKPTAAAVPKPLAAVVAPVVSAAVKPPTPLPAPIAKPVAAPTTAAPLTAAAPAATKPGSVTAAVKTESAPIIAASAKPAVTPSTAVVVPAADKPEVMPVAKPSLAQTPPPAESGFGDILGQWRVLIAALLAAVLGLFGIKALRSKKVMASKPVTQTPVATPPPRVLATAAAVKLGDTLARPPRPTNDDTQVITQQFNSSAVDQMNSTLILEPELAASLQSSAKHSAVQENRTDFDMTTQLQAETLQINLDSNDPVSEADFHLAYGLYDEAILLLKQAAANTPNRTDIRTKLAETYFAAGRPMEFQGLAEELKTKITAAEWSKLSIMGAQLCPDVALFRSDTGSNDLAADFDLGFDEPTAAVMATSLPPAAMSLPALAVAAPKSELQLDLEDEFNDDFKLNAAALSAGPASSAQFDDAASIDFMLGQSITPLGAGNQSASGADLLEFNLAPTELNFIAMPSDKPVPGVVDDPLAHLPTLTPAVNLEALDFSLRDLEVSITPRDVNFTSASDEFDTKLDLARAYVEMGDNEMARGLLQEVKQQGSDQQKQEAAGLLQRIPG